MLTPYHSSLGCNTQGVTHQPEQITNRSAQKLITATLQCCNDHITALSRQQSVENAIDITIEKFPAFGPHSKCDDYPIRLFLAPLPWPEPDSDTTLFALHHKDASD